mgnify:CR=1 FL=1
MEDTVMDNKRINLDYDIDKVNISLYGKKFVDFADEYVKEHQNFFKDWLSISAAFKKDLVPFDVKVKQLSELMSEINYFVRQSYLNGLYRGHNFKYEPYELNDVVDKDFMIAFYLGDNDFGGYVEEAIKNWVDKWNTVVYNVKRYRYSDSEHMVKGELEKLDKFEDITNISKLLANSVVSLYINHNNDNITDYGNFKDLDTCFENAKLYVYDLNLRDTSAYHKGSIKDITKWLNNSETDDNQHADEETEDEIMDLNGEYLIIKVEKGYASAWVQ